MKITIVIPNYNGAELITKNLPKVLEAVKGQKEIEILIPDDASRKEDRQKLMTAVSHARYVSHIPVSLIHNSKNRGFASNVNSGAFASHAEFLMFLNSDVIPKGGFLAPLLEDFKKDSNLFGVGCMEESKEVNSTVLRGRGTARWKRGMVVHQRGDVGKSDTFWVSGGSSMVRASIFKKIGGFDPLYNPFYWEDIDLSYKAQKAGYNILFDKRSVVIHEHDKGVIKKQFTQTEVNVIAYRNQFIFVWKNISSAKLLLSHMLWLPYYILRAIVSFDSAFLFGFCLALLRLPAIINRRVSQKRLWRRHDSDIIRS